MKPGVRERYGSGKNPLNVVVDPDQRVDQGIHWFPREYFMYLDERNPAYLEDWFCVELGAAWFNWSVVLSLDKLCQGREMKWNIKLFQLFCLINFDIFIHCESKKVKAVQ